MPITTDSSEPVKDGAVYIRHTSVHHPEHYCRNGHECMFDAKAMMDGAPVTPMEAAWWFCAFRYIWRWPYKDDPLGDLKKAKNCIDQLIQEVERDGRYNPAGV